MIGIRVLIPLLITCIAPFVSTAQISAQIAQSPSRLPSKGLRTTDQVLNQVCDFLKAQKSFTVEMDVTYDNMLDSGEKVQYSAYQTVWVQKPKRLRVDYIGDQRNTRFYYDGKSFTLQSPDLNTYATKAAPPTIDEVIDKIQEDYDITIPMSNLFVSNPCQALSSDIKRSVFVGTDMVNRVPGYHILFAGENRDWQLWVTQDKQPLPLKVVITYRNLPGNPQYTAVLSRWNFNPTIPADTFTFKPPAGAYGIEFLPPRNASTATQK